MLTKITTLGDELVTIKRTEDDEGVGYEVELFPQYADQRCVLDLTPDMFQEFRGTMLKIFNREGFTKTPHESRQNI